MAADFQVKILNSVQSDFSEADPYLKVVGFTHDGKLVVTGGEDGSVRTWKVREGAQIQTPIINF